MLASILLVCIELFNIDPIAIGEASYYRNEEFGGKPTASGEIFDDIKMTCAMPTGEFGTYYLVTARNKAVIVRLTDRGPFVKDRIIDLSKAAMAKLIDLDEGVVNVTIYQLRRKR